MDAQFHTPNFGDEVFDLTDVDSYGTYESALGGDTLDHTFSDSDLAQPFLMQSDQQTQRMRSLDNVTVITYSNNDNEDFVSPSEATDFMAQPTTTAADKPPTSGVGSGAQTLAKPLSAYALFFRDTVSAIKKENPGVSFHELSRIVSNLWESLEESVKNSYFAKQDQSRSEYFKQADLPSNAPQSHGGEDFSTPTPMQTKPAVFTIPRNNAEQPMDLVPPEQSQQTLSFQQFYDLQTTPGFAQPLEALQPCANADTQPNQDAGVTPLGDVTQKCIRDGCHQRAIINPDWEDEYCSNECVVTHCRNVFNSWVRSNVEERT